MKGILLPAAVMVVWTMIMAFWMLSDRMKMFKRHNIDLNKHPGARGMDLAKMVGPKEDWPAHNYVHLLEQPTIFYAAVFILALSAFSPLDVALAWAYFALRVVHSVFQATVNKVPVRGMIFGLSSIVMTVLAVRALLVVLSLPAA
ncbi:MAG: MAPEG family protein [Alphaproteobacteria bacterium]|nr:MAPEG family protein [Alphaproteobacteria bacterium]